MATEKWIQKSGVAENKGGLHRALGVPEGQKIPADKLAAAAHSKNPHVRHMAQFAKTAKGFSHPALKQAADSHRKYFGS